MAPARGDRKPCTHAECAGTMQFGRELLRQTSSALAVDGEPGWVCSDDPEHFLLAPHRHDAAASSIPDACWDDHGRPVNRSRAGEVQRENGR
jgi:hypothetical protein